MSDVHSVAMETETLKPVVSKPKAVKQTPKGRMADLLATGLSLFASLLAFITSALFFLGFVMNSGGSGELISAFLFSALLGAFAIGPSLIIARLAFRGYKNGLTRRAAAMCIFLSLPWIVLSLVVLTQAPLPAYISGLALLLASLLCLWAIISLALPPPHLIASRASDIK